MIRSTNVALAGNGTHVGLVRIINENYIIKMESEKLKEIYKELKSFCKENNIETGKSGYLMGLFTKYHRALSQHDVIKNEVSVCVHVRGSIVISEDVVYAECRICGELY